MTNGEYFVLTHPNIKVEENGTCVWIYNLDSTICNHHTMSMEWWNEEMVDIRPKGKWIEININPVEFGGYTSDKKCPFCGHITSEYLPKFCSHCGADMRGDKQGNCSSYLSEKIRWTDKLSVISNGDIVDFDGRVVGHINLADYGRGDI